MRNFRIGLDYESNQILLATEHSSSYLNRAKILSAIVPVENQTSSEKRRPVTEPAKNLSPPEDKKPKPKSDKTV